MTNLSRVWQLSKVAALSALFFMVITDHWPWWLIPVVVGAYLLGWIEATLSDDRGDRP